MKSMLAAALLVLIAGLAGNREVPVSGGEPLPYQLAGYDRYTYDARTAIPDGDPTGILIGPVNVPGATPIEDVILAVSLEHPYTGDVALRLCYDADRDGKPEAEARIDLFRIRDDAEAPEHMAVPMDLNGVYYFKDQVPGALVAEHVSEEEAALQRSTAFSVFNGVDRGGSFFLAAADTTSKDIGQVACWAVYLKSSSETRSSSPLLTHCQ